MNSLLILCLVISPIYGLEGPIVNLTSGPIEGIVQGPSYNPYIYFAGIPYAKPPIGKLRLQLPVKPDPWTEVKKLNDHGPACIQPESEYTLKSQSEDCLYLNVYVNTKTFSNKTDQLVPVMFYIHGGDLTTGAVHFTANGYHMTNLYKVVLVTINYRLGALGFMNFGSQEPKIPFNLGFHDQLFALKWVKENIQNFGGDPNDITIFGTSGGSISVSAHLLSPLSRGLFKHAIIQSGTVYMKHDNDKLIQDSMKLYSQTSCSQSEKILDCLQNLPIEEIANITSDKSLAFSFAVGDDFLPYEPDKMLADGLYDNSIDLLLGVVKNEGSIFMHTLDPEVFDIYNPQPISYQKALNYLGQIFDNQSIDYWREVYGFSEKDESDQLRTRLERAFSDVSFVCPTYMFGYQYASALGKKSDKVFAYYHTQRPSGYFEQYPRWVGDFHESEICHIFGVPLGGDFGQFAWEDLNLSEKMMKIWVNWAYAGKPPSNYGYHSRPDWKPLLERNDAIVLDEWKWGKMETERIEFCLKEWRNMSPYIGKEQIDIDEEIVIHTTKGPENFN